MINNLKEDEVLIDKDKIGDYNNVLEEDISKLNKRFSNKLEDNIIYIDILNYNLKIDFNYLHDGCNNNDKLVEFDDLFSKLETNILYILIYKLN